MIALALVAGYLAGLIVVGLTFFIDNLRIAFGNLALYGNGALIVPLVLAPFALYPGWVWLLSRKGDRRLEAALFVAGLVLGVGTPGAISAVRYAQSENVPLLSLGPGVLLGGAFFVVPAALFCAAALWLVRSGRVDVTPLTTAFAMVIAALTVPLFGAGLGVLSGGATALALARPTRGVTIGLLLLALFVLVCSAPFAFFALVPTAPAP